MAEIRTANIAKLVTKQAGRAKEKLLQNLGKADKTTDEIFEEHLLNFNLQQANATRLQKDISNYIRCIKAMQTASKNLMDTLTEVYEPQWTGQDLLTVQGQNSEMLWADLAHKLSDQVLIPLNTYQGQFPEMRKKIEKRGRKLIDYDKERHNVQTLQANPNRNEAKYARAKEAMESAKRTYEILNSELHDELPALFDSRVLFLVTNQQTLFAAEEVFHSETAKVYSELEAIIDKLAKDVQKGTLPKKILPKPPMLNQSINSASSLGSPPKGELMDAGTGHFNPTGPLSPIHESDLEANNLQSTGSKSPPQPPSTNNNEILKVQDLEAETETTTNGTSSPSRHFGSSFGSHSRADYEPVGALHSNKGQTNGASYTNTTGSNQPAGSNEMYDIPVGASTTDLPPGVLYRVKASYKYQAEDVDELAFEVGEVINVVEYEDTEDQEQEEGWLMGVKEATGQKGMFPANFTRPM